MEDKNMEEGENNREMEVAPALISVHPFQQSVAISVGSDIRVFNLKDGYGVSLVDENGGMHTDFVRDIRFSGNGKVFVSAGDDKLVKVWSTDSWHCIGTMTSEKRVSAVAIDKSGRYICFADKFGVVYGWDTEWFDGTHAPLNKKAVPLLGHYCSIITSLEFSPDGKFILSADRDFKIRVTVFPSKTLLDGPHEIQSFCLGHTEFVSCLAFVSNVDRPHGYLVSGSGDSTVRLWDFTTGSLLDTCDVGSKAGVSQSNGKEEESPPAVTDLCPTSDGSLVAVAIQNLSGILLLSCNLSSGKLSIAQVVSIPGENFIPTSLGAALSEPKLWIIMGASSSRVSDSASLARVRVISKFSGVIEQEATVLDDSDIPGGQPLLQKLQGNISVGEEAFSTAAEAVKTAMRNLLIKKQYSIERRENRKCGRNDKKIKK